MTTRDWAVDAAEDAMLFCDTPVLSEDGKLRTDPAKQMYMLADRIRGYANFARGERDGEVADIREAITEAIGFEWGEGELQTVNGEELLRIAALAHPRPVVLDETDEVIDAMVRIVARECGEDFSKLDAFTLKCLRDTQRQALRAAREVAATHTTNAGRG